MKARNRSIQGLSLVVIIHVFLHGTHAFAPARLDYSQRRGRLAGSPLGTTPMRLSDSRVRRTTTRTRVASSFRFHHKTAIAITRPPVFTFLAASSTASVAAASTTSSNTGDIWDKPKRFWSTHQIRPFVSTAFLILLDIIFRFIFGRAKIRFPSSLAGSGVLLAALLVQPNDTLYHWLQPGALLLAKWLPVFFVPSLVTLPLAAGVGCASDIIKVSLVLVGGFVFTLLSTSYAVVTVRESQQNVATAATVTVSANATTTTDQEGREAEKTPYNHTETSLVVRSKLEPPTKPFSNELLRNLVFLASSTGLVGSLGFLGASLAKSLTSVSLLSTTLASFVLGARLPKKVTKVVHPLVTCTVLTWSMVALLAFITGHTFKGMLRSYRTGSAWTGAGDILLFLLGPAVVSLAISIYDRRELVQENAVAVATGVGVSTLGGVFGTALAVRLAGIVIPAVRLSLLSRNITSPLAMAIANLLGADASLAVSMVVISGLIGANFGASILNAVGIQDAVARGLGVGSASHGLGTAALADEPDAFPFSAIAMALTASAATVTVSIPVLRRIILQLALG